MFEQPLVSINLTTYNRANLLKRSLKSIISQSYKNIEIIIVDDFSTDNTEEVIRGLIKSDNRIKYIKHNNNKGNAAARNTAWQNSNGKYIAFMDDDDEWIDNEKLKKQVELFEKSDNKLGIICTSVLLVDEYGNKIEKVIKKPYNLKQYILRGNGIIYSPTVMTKKLILEYVGGFDEKMPRGVDSEFYRNCIVKYDYDVLFLPDITTLVDVGHSYNRMTPKNNIIALQKENVAIKIILNKYSKEFSQNKQIKYRRIFTIIKNLVLINIKKVIFLWKRSM